MGQSLIALPWFYVYLQNEYHYLYYLTITTSSEAIISGSRLEMLLAVQTQCFRQMKKFPHL